MIKFEASRPAASRRVSQILPFRPTPTMAVPLSLLPPAALFSLPLPSARRLLAAGLRQAEYPHPQTFTLSSLSSTKQQYKRTTSMKLTKIPPPIRPTNGKLPVAPKTPLSLRCWRVQKKPFNAVLEEMRPYLIEDRGNVATREMMVLSFFWSRKYNVVDHERDTLSDNVWLWRVG